MSTPVRFIVLLLLSLPIVARAQTITSTTESTPHAGIRIVQGRTTGPATNFHAAYVSLCSDSVHIDASSYGSTGSASSWGRSVGAQLAVNGDFYTTTPRTHVYGDAVAGGTRWPMNRTGLDSDYASDWYYNDFGWIAFGDGWVDFSNTKHVKNRGLSTSGYKPDDVAPDPPAGTKALVSGFPQLVIDGAPVTCASPTASDCFVDRTDMRARHPRTAMGLSRDRQTFILVVVDGRSTASVGMYGAELAKLMADLGAYTAFNLDGGGSSQMWVAGDGTINQPSDGTPRSVVNHWGVFASAANGLPVVPGSCDNSWDGLLHVLQGQLQRTTDLDGDGLGDACIRTPAGVECSLSDGAQFGPPIAGPALTDAAGWADPSNYATMRWGDINGDGKADLCARADAGIRCWTFDGTSFSEPIVGPALSDESGFDHVSLYSTLRFADITGDGMDDLCVRWTDGMRCYPSNGTGFEAEVAGPELSDAVGWGDPSNYGTIRTGDVDGDGKDDVCARANAGMRCWLTDGARIDGPAWSNAAGWAKFRHWSTIRLVDLDNDGRADLCARGADGLQCALSTGDGFGALITGPALSDAAGWDDYSNFATLRFADVTGDGVLDACARSNDGVRCWPFDGASFGAPISGPLVDASGWTGDRFHRTIDFVDIDADGRADLCARASQGLVCWRSLGDAFAEELTAGPQWSDAAGFDAKKLYSTMALLGAVRPAPIDAVIDPDPDVDPEPSTNNGTAPDPTPVDAMDDEGAQTADRVVDGGAGGCATAGSAADAAWLVLVVGVLVVLRRRR